MVEPIACNVCIDGQPAIVYESARSLTSLCVVREEPTRVRACPKCGHVQTDELVDSATYYDQDYEILTDSEEEDQIYEVRDGTKIYRTQHQLEVLLGRLKIGRAAKILDFGCAKSSIMRNLAAERPDVEPYLFDVSDRYLPFWEKFVPRKRCATYEIPGSWDSSFDIVTSFFSLEHISNPTAIVETIARLLKPGGEFYGVVPNLFGNIADLIVIDHPNHFTSSSLDCLIRSAGLLPTGIDDTAHRGAWVFTAMRPADTGDLSWHANEDTVGNSLLQTRAIATFWVDAADRLRTHEAMVPSDAPLAIYGAGFYGAFIYASLDRPGRVRCFIDQNPYLQGRNLHGVPVLSPDTVPHDLSNVLVGLNPGHAESIIQDIPALRERGIEFYYL